MLIHLGETATVRDILDKLNILFAEVSNNGMITQEFFNAYQFQGECATSTGCRLESMLHTAIDNGYLNRSSKNDLLRHKFWTSLNSERLSTESLGSRLRQHAMTAESEVEESIAERIQRLQAELEGKLEGKFNKILKKIDEPRRDDSRQNCLI